jgi:hypothetical protein
MRPSSGITKIVLIRLVKEHGFYGLFVLGVLIFALVGRH